MTGDFASSLSDFAIGIGKGVSGWVAAYKRPIINTVPSWEFQGLKGDFSSLSDTLAVPMTVNDECIGCGQCVNVCDNFELGDDGKSHPKEDEVDEKGCNEAASDVCPVKAIIIEEV